MLIKIAALGSLAYVGFKFLRSVKRPDVTSPSDLRIAGGPLSENATILRTAVD